MKAVTNDHRFDFVGEPRTPGEIWQHDTEINLIHLHTVVGRDSGGYFTYGPNLWLCETGMLLVGSDYRWCRDFLDHYMYETPAYGLEPSGWLPGV